jgi:hypothetical protein
MRKTIFGFSLLTLLLWSSIGYSKNSLARRSLLGKEPFHFLTENTQENLDRKKNYSLIQNLVHIISDPQDGLIHFLNLELNEDGSIINLIRQIEDSNDKQIVSMVDLMKKPAVLARAADRDILILKCNACNAENGGSIQLDYLYNGMTMSYKHLKLDLVKDGEWKLFPRNNSHDKSQQNNHEKIISLRLVPRVVFGQLVGIKEILVNK